MPSKITALKNANDKIEKTIRSYKTLLYSESQLEKANVEEDVVNRHSNDETSCLMLKLKGGQKTPILIEDEFKRIICLKGIVRINIPSYEESEEIILESINTILIPPKTEYILEIIKDCEIVTVYKPKKDFYANVLKVE